MRKYARAEKTALAAPKPMVRRRLLYAFAVSLSWLLRSAVLKKTLARNARMLVGGSMSARG